MIKTTKSLTDVGNILNDKYELTWKTAKATNYKLDGEKFGTLSRDPLVFITIIYCIAWTIDLSTCIVWVWIFWICTWIRVLQ